MNSLSIQLIKSTGLSNIQSFSYPELKSSFFTADYLYEKGETIIAQYIMIQCSHQEFQTVFLRNSNFYEEVVQKIFFNCYDSDLCWNLYQICVMDDEEYNLVAEEELTKFESNTNYTRKQLITLSEFTKTIPVGKVKVRYKVTKNSMISPKEEWSGQLKKEGLEFCGQDFAEKNLEKYIEEGEWTENTEESKKRRKNYTINSIDNIVISNNFRNNCFTKKQMLEFGQVNMIAGKNGSGKTSILEGIELVITGTVRKAMGVYNNYSESTGMQCVANHKQRIIKPYSTEEILRRATTWYHKNSKNEQELNSEFHLYNYFTAVDTFILSYMGDKQNLKYQFFQVLFGEETLSFYENIEKYLEKTQSMIEETQKSIDEMEKLYGSYQDSMEEVKISAQHFFKEAKQYPISFSQSSDLNEIINCIKACKELCEEIDNYEKILKYTDILSDRKEISDQQKKIEGMRKEVEAIEEEIKQYGESNQRDWRKKNLLLSLEYEESILQTYIKSTKNVSKINDLYVQAEKILDFKTEKMRIKKVYEICIELEAILTKNDYYHARQRNVFIENEMSEKNERIDVLSNIKRRLLSLKTPEYYMEKYVGNNIEQISDIFLLLQSPKEYDGLKFTVDSDLVGFRRNETVPLYMMSSGQRVAAVMALFFCVHLSADCIPNVILLDEPVGHIDELNILSLFDLLRELVIQYDKQLFFTTSTKEIQKLFERKFSFLQKEYKEFLFQRKGRDKTEITWKTPSMKRT